MVSNITLFWGSNFGHTAWTFSKQLLRVIQRLLLRGCFSLPLLLILISLGGSKGSSKRKTAHQRLVEWKHWKNHAKRQPDTRTHIQNTNATTEIMKPSVSYQSMQKPIIQKHTMHHTKDSNQMSENQKKTALLWSFLLNTAVVKYFNLTIQLYFAISITHSQFHEDIKLLQ